MLARIAPFFIVQFINSTSINILLSKKLFRGFCDKSAANLVHWRGAGSSGGVVLMQISNSMSGHIPDTFTKTVSPESRRAKPTLNFSELLNSLDSAKAPFELPASGSLENMNRSADFVQLLNYQIQVSRYGLKVELSSKLIESVNASIRKLETASQ